MHQPIKDLSANPLALVRTLPTKNVPTNQIKLNPNKPEDIIFLAKYKGYLAGKTSIHETRISLKKIRRGFWRKINEEWKLECDAINSENLDYMIQIIRLGDRPTIHLYENPNPLDNFRFVCTDDAVTHAAYEHLGISKVPAALMAKPRDLEESCLSIRHLPRGRGKSIPLLEGTIPVVSEMVPSILGPTKPSTEECFALLIASLATTKQLVRNFHLPGSTVHHYHHTLYSVLLRAEECIESMRLLVESDKSLTATGLLRSLHELALVFYVDWLAPSHTYRYLQIASVMTEKKWEESCISWQKEDIAEGASPIEARNLKDARMRSFRLASVVGERARIFPLGEKFQKDIYSFLSDVIHHDFSMTARYAFTLDHGDEAVYNEDILHTIIHLSDILVGAIVSRIRDDIGTNFTKKEKNI